MAVFPPQKAFKCFSRNAPDSHPEIKQLTSIDQLVKIVIKIFIRIACCVS